MREAIAATTQAAVALTARPNYHFASDNTSGVCPEAWAALTEANLGRIPSYGDDEFTARAIGLFRQAFEADCEVFLVFNGTAANALALAALCRPHHSILCHESSHLDTDECGAPEFFTGGSKVIPIAGPDGKLQPKEVELALGRGRGVHFPKPGALSLTQSTERGTVYEPGEVAALAALAHDRGAAVHMDGARFANAAAALGEGGFSPADLTWRAGVDVLSFGGTKNGMLSTEAVVFFDRDRAREFSYRVKQGGQLASKMRFAGAQWASLLAGGGWLRDAAHANRMAGRLAAGLREISGVRLLVEPAVNAVFVEFAPPVAAALRSRGWRFHPFIGEHGYRLMCSWASRDEDIAAFLTDLRAVLA